MGSGTHSQPVPPHKALVAIKMGQKRKPVQIAEVQINYFEVFPMIHQSFCPFLSSIFDWRMEGNPLRLETYDGSDSDQEAAEKLDDGADTESPRPFDTSFQKEEQPSPSIKFNIHYAQGHNK